MKSWLCLLLTFVVEHAQSRVVERIELKLADGSQHSALLSFPETRKKPLPVMIVMGGFDTGEKSISLLPDHPGLIYGTTDYPFKAPQQRSFVRDLKEVPAIKRAVSRADLAVDALIEALTVHPKIDSKKMVMVGASFGAPFTVTAAARNSKLQGAILIHAFGRIDRAIEQQLVNEWGSLSRPLARMVGWAAWTYLDYSEPEEVLRKLHPHQKLLYIYSKEDDQLPKISIDSFKEGLKASPAEVTSINSTGGHLGPGKNELISELMNISLKWLKEKKFL